MLVCVLATSYFMENAWLCNTCACAADTFAFNLHVRLYILARGEQEANHDDQARLIRGAAASIVQALDDMASMNKNTKEIVDNAEQNIVVGFRR